MKAILNHAVGLALESKFVSALQSKISWKKSQEKTWKKIKTSLEGTKIYQDLNLSQVASYEDYLGMVKPVQFEDYSSYVTRLKSGESDVLFKGKNTYFGLTSGTSGKDSKHIPYNESLLQIFQDSQKMLAGLTYKHKSMNPITSKRFTYGSSPVCSQDENFIYGYISGILSSRIPKILERGTYPKRNVLEITNWDEKLTAMIESTKDQDIEVIAGIPTYIITIMEKILERTGKKSMIEVWPNLRTMIYGATPITQYKRRINELIGRSLNYYGIYASTEAPLGICVNNAKDQAQEYTFVPGVLYSFATTSEPKKLLGIHDLQAGSEYLLHVGTPNGFLQYAMKDIIRVIRVEPYVTFDVLGREGSQLNLAAEKTTEKHLLDTIELTTRELNLPIKHHMCFPDEKTASYFWTVFIDDPSKVDQTVLRETLDKNLRLINADYDDCRIDKIINPPQVRCLEASALQIYFNKNRDKGQFKMKTTFTSEIPFYEFFMTNFERAFLPQESL